MNRRSFVSGHGIRRLGVSGLGIGLLAATLLAACSDPSTIAANSLNLNRPVDMSFACYGGLRITADGSLITSAQPTTSCDVRGQERYYPTNADGTAVTPPEPRPPGQEDNGDSVLGATDWFGFILQSVPGTVAISTWSTQPASRFAGDSTEVVVLDADPLTPSKNAISIGEEPIAIATDRTGCFVVTANAGSCDLSTLDVNGAVTGNPRINRLPIMNGSVELLARPAAMVGEPASDQDVIGQACPATPHGLAYIALPSCHAVVAVDPSDGLSAKVVSAIQLDAAGVPTILSGAALSGLSCAIECARNSAGATVTPTVPSAGPRPVALAYRLDPAADKPRQLAIGAEHSNLLTMVELLYTPPASPPVAQPPQLPIAVTQVALDDKTKNAASTATNTQPLGITALALSAQIATGGSQGQLTSTGTAQYVYAITNDHTVRVVDVLGKNNRPPGSLPAVPGVPTECDTQIDTRFLQSAMAPAGTGTTPTPAGALNGVTAALQCFPVGGFPTTPTTKLALPRRATARGPGIELVGEGVPTSVAFFTPTLALDVNQSPIYPTTSPISLVGTFAAITVSTGSTVIANVDDDNNDAGTDLFDPTRPQDTAPVLIMAHQLRDNVASRGAIAQALPLNATADTPQGPSCLQLGLTNNGGPRATTPPVPDASLGTIASTKIGELPSLRQVSCAAPDVASPIAISEMEFPADPLTRNLVFPDLRDVQADENYTLIWEGPLSADAPSTAVDGPIVREGQLRINSTVAASLVDQTRPFCGIGAEPFDVVQLRGCDPANKNLDCPNGYQCYVHPESTIKIGAAVLGACILSTEVDRLASACRDFLVSQRRYTVHETFAGELELVPRRHELRTTPLDGCTSDTQCQQLADYAVQTGHDVFSAADVDPHKWACQADADRKPLTGGSTMRCVQTCTADTDCEPGSLCAGPDKQKVCMEGVMPPPACVAGPQRYDVRAGEAFTVIGDHTGYTHPIIMGPSNPDPVLSNACVVDPKASPLQRGRIPLSAPACAADADPITGEIRSAPGTFEPNPCTVKVTQTSLDTPYTGAACAAGTPVLNTRPSVDAIKLRTRALTLTLVDPTYPGDAVCPLDRGGVPGIAATDRVPLVFPGFKIAFHVTSGYTPLTVEANSTLFNPVFPVKVVPGPAGSFWVLDDGDFLSTTIGLASTEGAVYRVDSQNLGIVNQLQ